MPSLAAAGHEAELVGVPEELLPADLRLTRRLAQHVLVDSGKARRVLGWRPEDPAGPAPDPGQLHSNSEPIPRRPRTDAA